MAIKEITMWQTSDEEVFRTRPGAINHERKINFRTWYESHKCYGGVVGCRIEANEMMEWLDEHEEDVLVYFGLKEKS